MPASTPVPPQPSPYSAQNNPVVPAQPAMAVHPARPPARAGGAGARVPAPVRAGPQFGRADPRPRRVRRRCDAAGLAVRARGGRAPDAARGDRLLPRLPAVLPALVGARPRDPDLDPRPLAARHVEPRAGADQLPLTGESASSMMSGRAYGPVEMTSPSDS